MNVTKYSLPPKDVGQISLHKSECIHDNSLLAQGRVAFFEIESCARFPSMQLSHKSIGPEINGTYVAILCEPSD